MGNTKVSENEMNSQVYRKNNQMQKDMIISKLKQNGGRITKQRLLIIDIILESECTCCKEIYFKASRIDSKIGTATVYRMINKLEEIGAINRKNMYKVSFGENCSMDNACTVILDDDTVFNLSAQNWNKVVHAGLVKCGYLNEQKICSISVRPCECGTQTA